MWKVTKAQKIIVTFKFGGVFAESSTSMCKVVSFQLSFYVLVLFLLCFISGPSTVYM